MIVCPAAPAAGSNLSLRAAAGGSWLSIGIASEFEVPRATWGVMFRDSSAETVQASMSTVAVEVEERVC